MEGLNIVEYLNTIFYRFDRNKTFYQLFWSSCIEEPQSLRCDQINLLFLSMNVYKQTYKRTHSQTHHWTCHRRHLIPQIILDVFESAWNVESCCWIQLNVIFFEEIRMNNNGVELEFWKRTKKPNEFAIKLLCIPIT